MVKYSLTKTISSCVYAITHSPEKRIHTLLWHLKQPDPAVPRRRKMKRPEKKQLRRRFPLMTLLGRLPGKARRVKSKTSQESAHTRDLRGRRVLYRDEGASGGILTTGHLVLVT